MRLVIEVREELHERFKACVREEGRTQAEVIRTLIEGYVDHAIYTLRRADTGREGRHPEDGGLR